MKLFKKAVPILLVRFHGTRPAISWIDRRNQSGEGHKSGQYENRASTCYLLPDSAFDLHLEFHGRAHSAGDIFVLCPQQSSIATGDACMGWVPNLGDAYPKDWPRTLDAVGQIGFAHVLGGHGALESGHGVMRSLGTTLKN